MSATTWTCCFCRRARSQRPALEYQHIGCCQRYDRVCRGCVVSLALDAGVVDRQGEHRRQAARSKMVRDHALAGCG